MNNIAKGKNNKKQTKQLLLWIGALVVGAALGMLGIAWLNGLMNFIATVYTRLFQLLAVPTIALAVMTTLASLGNQADTGKIFRHAITYTLLTTFAAAAVGLVLYNVIAPGNLPAALVQSGMADVPQNLGETSYYDHILGVIPNNIVKPFADGNVLSILMLAAAVGIAGIPGAAVISLGSDGTDGPSDAAGGYSDYETAAELKAQGVEIFQVLQNNDAFHALEKFGGLIYTGPTGTNVNDVAVALLG